MGVIGWFSGRHPKRLRTQGSYHRIGGKIKMYENLNCGKCPCLSFFTGKLQGKEMVDLPFCSWYGDIIKDIDKDYCIFPPSEKLVVHTTPVVSRHIENI